MRTSIGAPTCSPSAPSAVARVVGQRRRGRGRCADVSRNASRTVARRSSVSRRGSCPASSSSPSATSAPATSSSATARRIASRPSNALPAEQRADLLDVDRAVGDGLVEQRQRVAHRAGAGPRDDRERLGVGVDPFLRAHVGEVRGDLVDRVERELVVLGARADRGRDLQRVGGGEHEHDVLGRLLERLEQRGLRAARSACAPRRGCTPSSRRRR